MSERDRRLTDVSHELAVELLRCRTALASILRGAPITSNDQRLVADADGVLAKFEKAYYSADAGKAVASGL